MNSKFIPVLLILLLFACTAELENDTRKNFIAVSSDSDDYQKSRDKLDAIIAQNPNHVNALVDRGNLEFDHYDFLDAFSDAARAYRLDSNHFEAKLLYAKALINRHSRTEKDKITAQGHFLELLIIKPDNLNAMVGLANTYALLQDFDNSRIWINKALEIDSKFIDAYILKGSIYKILYNALRGDAESNKLANAYLDTAILTYSYITQIYPEHHYTYMQLGLLFEKKGDSICLDHYTSAVQLQPNNLNYKYSLAYAYGEFGEEREAIRLYEEMIHQDENCFEAYCQTGQILQFKYKELDSALYYYAQVVRKAPLHVDAYVNMGIAYQDKGDLINALKNYSKALAIKPEERDPMVSVNQFNEHQGMARKRADQLKKRL